MYFHPKPYKVCKHMFMIELKLVVLVKGAPVVGLTKEIPHVPFFSQFFQHHQTMICIGHVWRVFVAAFFVAA